MKIIYFSFFFFLFSCSQKKSNSLLIKAEIPRTFIDKSSVFFNIKKDTLFINQKRFSGYIFELQSNRKDTLSLESYYLGLKSGVSEKWFDNKKIMEKRSYFQGRKNGEQIVFWENGHVKFQFIAKDDANEGEMKEWNIDGKLIHLGNYKNGQEEGAQKLWYDSGKIRANYVMINGKRYGLLGTKNCKNVSDSVFVVK